MQSTTAQQSTTYNVAIELQISQLHQSIRSNPAKVEYRVHLAQLLMISGQWDRCLQQLQTTAQLDPKSIPMAQTYRELICAEIFREQVFIGQRAPAAKVAVEPWQDLLAEALVARANNQPAIADELQQQAYNQAPTCKFSINDQVVSWIADGDSRLGPICELFINGSYYWVPFTQIQQMTLEPPKDLRDLVWSPATIILMDSSEHVCFLPSRYAASYAVNNDQLALSALTEWTPLSAESWAGLGQKILIADEAEFSLLSIRTLQQLSGN